MMWKRRSTLAAASAIWLAGMSGGARAATTAQIDTAIDSGLANLASQQTSGGYWNYGGYEQAATGAVVGAFMSQQALWGGNAAAYQSVVNNGMNYLLSTASTNVVGVRTDGNNPCGAGSCTGIYWNGSGESTYTTGLVASAIGQYAAAMPTAVATSSGPLAGMTWQQIAQGITNEFAAGQTTANNQVYAGARGGWRYFPSGGDSDGSTTQWAVLSMIYDQSLGATTPGFVKSELRFWTNFDQASNGAGCYQGQGSGICEASDTGALLIDHAFMGDGPGNPQVAAALAYLNANWKQFANNTWFGNFDQPYAMWAQYKALELELGLDDTSFTNLLTDCGTAAGNPPDSGICNWWQDYNQHLVDMQNPDGSWNGYGYWYGPLATAFDVSILGGTVIPPQPAPEPTTLSLLGAGLAGIGILRRRCRIA